MIHKAAYGLAALVSLIPVAAVAWRPLPARPYAFWLALAAAVIGTGAWSLAWLGAEWRTGLSGTLWASVAATLALFAGLAAASREGRRLAPLLLVWLLAMALLALAWQVAPGQPVSPLVPSAWMAAHIATAVAAYGLLTLAAVAGWAVLLQQRALKTKRPTGLATRLPSVAGGERLQVRLLAAAEGVLAASLASGMAAQHFETGTLLVVSHKVLFVWATFIVIALLLVAHWRTGLRGRRVARLVLLAWLLLSLAVPGVKFVTDVLMS